MEELRVIYTVADPGFFGGFGGLPGTGGLGRGGSCWCWPHLRDWFLPHANAGNTSVTNPKLTARKVGSSPHKKNPSPFSVPSIHSESCPIFLFWSTISAETEKQSLTKPIIEDSETSVQNTPSPIGTSHGGLRNFDPEYPLPPPGLEILMEDLETLVQNTPSPTRIGTSHEGLRNFVPEYPLPHQD